MLMAMEKYKTNIVHIDMYIDHSKRRKMKLIKKIIKHDWENEQSSNNFQTIKKTKKKVYDYKRNRVLDR